MLNHIKPKSTKLDPSHEAYKHMNTCLQEARVYDAQAASDFVTQLSAVLTLTDPECQDVLRIMLNVSKVRSITGKRPERYESPALGVLWQHAKKEKMASPSEKKNVRVA